ncbi:MAG: nicotinate phosphoribosyltransferase [Chlamydiota bacterium]
MNSIYGEFPGNFSLLTDLYELTMAYSYWKNGLADVEAVFHAFYRRKPFGGGFVVAAGLESVINYINNFCFQESDIAYLASLEGEDGSPLFEEEFLDYLRALKITLDIDALPEGTVVFPYEPMVRVQGPIIECQIIESALLNMINFPSLIATKAARLRIAAGEDKILEFGLRRAQGVDGALTASRSAYIGGCDATSNVLAGRMFGIPVKGTIAHSWVMLFEDELEAFMKYAQAMPHNCILLVDTYDSLEGVAKAITVGRWLREHGGKLAGIRLDSGDLAYLSIESRRMLDRAGFEDTKIVASNDLDETIINDLKHQGSAITIWGVGTKLVTAKDNPALDGVYKLSASRFPGQEWQYTLKLSEQAQKVSNPGVLQVRRYYDEQENIADVIYDINTDLAECNIIDPFNPMRQKSVAEETRYQDLLEPIFRRGRQVYSTPTLKDIKHKTQQELSRFHQGVKRFINPHEYVVGVEESLYHLKLNLVKNIKQHREE